MNKKELAMLARTSSVFGDEVSLLMDRFSRFVEEMKEKEEMKLDSLPESLEGSPLWSSIEDAIEMFEEIQVALEEMDSSLDSILETMGTTA